MIKQYTDHSANERTYLAWLRTAIAIMTFGFLIEKFDLFISQIGKTFPDEKQFHSSLPAELVGLGILLVGVFIVVSATLRFYVTKRSIESSELIAYTSKQSSVILSSLMFFIALFILIYMSRKVLGSYMSG